MSAKMFLSKYEVHIYSILRIVAGFLFLWHGSQKLFGFPPTDHTAPSYIEFIAGSIELIGGFLVMIGLWTRWAAFICSGTMAYAYSDIMGLISNIIRRMIKNVRDIRFIFSGIILMV